MITISKISITDAEKVIFKSIVEKIEEFAEEQKFLPDAIDEDGEACFSDKFEIEFEGAFFDVDFNAVANYNTTNDNDNNYHSYKLTNISVLLMEIYTQFNEFDVFFAINGESSVNFIVSIDDYFTQKYK
jgi:hypothetical protein